MAPLELSCAEDGGRFGGTGGTTADDAALGLVETKLDPPRVIETVIRRAVLRRRRAVLPCRMRARGKT